jgi:hexosaminidase
MSWRGIEGGIKAAKLRHNVVMTPSDYMYFDYYEGKPDEEPLSIGGFTPMRKVYDYEPVPESLNADEKKYITGVQACQWTEYIATPELVEYMTLPRLCALSEVAWSPEENKDFDDFSKRMLTHYGRLDEMDINYRRPRIKGFSSTNIFMEKEMIKWESQLINTEIRYTTDGSTPTKNSKLYTKPFLITETTNFKIVEFSSQGKRSKVYKADYIKRDPHEAVLQLPKNLKNGLKYEFFTFNGSMTSTGELLKMNPVSTGTVERFIYPMSEDKLPKKFGVIYSGYIKIPKTGIYTFSVISNDGSILLIDGHPVVKNDGQHSAFEKEGQTALKEGYHKIELRYFQAGGRKALQVFIKVPGKEKVEITKDMLVN